jgi:hypothetical protein
MNQPDNTHKIECSHQQDGSIRVIVPATMVAEFKQMAFRAINTWQDATPQMRDFIDRLLQRHQPQTAREFITNLPASFSRSANNPQPLFTDLTKATVRLIKRLEYFNLSPNCLLTLSDKEQSVIDGTNQLIWVKHGQVNAELHTYFVNLCARVGVDING